MTTLSSLTGGHQGQGWPRIIVYADPVDFVLVGRAVRYVMAPDYVWPADNVVCIQYGDKLTFGIIRRKSCITVYGPGHRAPLEAAA